MRGRKIVIMFITLTQPRRSIRLYLPIPEQAVHQRNRQQCSAPAAAAFEKFDAGMLRILTEENHVQQSFPPPARCSRLTRQANSWPVACADRIISR